MQWFRSLYFRAARSVRREFLIYKHPQVFLRKLAGALRAPKSCPTRNYKYFGISRGDFPGAFRAPEMLNQQGITSLFAKFWRRAARAGNVILSRFYKLFCTFAPQVFPAPFSRTLPYPPKVGGSLQKGGGSVFLRSGGGESLNASPLAPPDIKDPYDPT